jgi:2-oxoglutarate dehydrogenase E2 component (dihydrolipoamide succinyltransferase)
MPVELKVPSLGESVAEVEIAEWLKKEGDAIRADEDLVMLDSAKTTQPLPAPLSGVLVKILKNQGEIVAVGDAIALIEEGGASGKTSDNTAEPAPEWEKGESPAKPQTPAPPTPVPMEKLADAPKPKAEPAEPLKPAPSAAVVDAPNASNSFVMPAAAREMAQSGVKPEDVTASGPGGRVLKEDVQRANAERAAAQKSTPDYGSTPPVETAKPAAKPTPQTPKAPTPASSDEEVVPMTMLRRHIAQRLVEAQQNAALLTTFNEVNMSAVMELRKAYQDEFTKKHGIKLGFMSFFVKAAVDALKAFPAVNAEIRGRDIVYKNYYDIGVAIGSGKGLVVPVVRRAERLGFAEIEQQIADFAGKAKAGTLKPEDLEGGTFTITNGGIYGSMMSTPIVNPPQSGILGMHAITERPMAENGQVVIRPMMYIALTYDHRIIDGREAVSFLVRIKQCIENPARMLLEV